VGIPFGLKLAQLFRWEAPFFLLAGIASVVWLIAYFRLPPVRGHLKDGRATVGVRRIVADANAGRALLFMSVLVGGHLPFFHPAVCPPYLVATSVCPSAIFSSCISPGACSRVHRPAHRQGWRPARTVPGFSALVAVACVVTLIIQLRPPSGLGGGWSWVVLLCVRSGRFVPGQRSSTLAVPSSRRGAS